MTWWPDLSPAPRIRQGEKTPLGARPSHRRPQPRRPGPTSSRNRDCSPAWSASRRRGPPVVDVCPAPSPPWTRRSSTSATPTSTTSAKVPRPVRSTRLIPAFLCRRNRARAIMREERGDPVAASRGYFRNMTRPASTRALDLLEAGHNHSRGNRREASRVLARATWRPDRRSRLADYPLGPPRPRS